MSGSRGRTSSVDRYPRHGTQNRWENNPREESWTGRQGRWDWWDGGQHWNNPRHQPPGPWHWQQNQPQPRWDHWGPRNYGPQSQGWNHEAQSPILRPPHFGENATAPRDGYRSDYTGNVADHSWDNRDTYQSTESHGGDQQSESSLSQTMLRAKWVLDRSRIPSADKPSSHTVGPSSTNQRDRRSGSQDSPSRSSIDQSKQNEPKKDTLQEKLSLKANKIIDDVLKGGTGKNIALEDSKSKEREGTLLDRGASLLEKAETLCKELRQKREQAKANRVSTEERLQREDRDAVSKQIEALSERSMSRVKGLLSSESLTSMTSSGSRAVDTSFSSVISSTRSPNVAEFGRHTPLSATANTGRHLTPARDSAAPLKLPVKKKKVPTATLR